MAEAELTRAEKVDAKRLATLGRYAWTAGLPFLTAAALPLFAPFEVALFLMILGLEVFGFGFPVLLGLAAGLVSFGASERVLGGRVRVDERGLWIGERLVARDEIATAWGIGGGELEVITHDGDELRLMLRDPSQAPALGEALRALADRSRSWTLDDGGHIRWLLGKLAAGYVPLGLAGLLSGISPWMLATLPVAMATTWAFGGGRRRARFAADGVTVTGRFRTRYVPYREITRVRRRRTLALAHAVDVVLEDGTVVCVLSGMDEVRARIVEALIEEGRAMVTNGEEAGVALAGLESASEQDLLRRLAGAPQPERYREAALAPERLFDVVRNPAATASQRVAAAIALREAPGGRARLRVAAEVTDEPEVRVALEELAAEHFDEARGRAILRRLAR